jgi:hypothetical protein
MSQAKKLSESSTAASENSVGAVENSEIYEKLKNLQSTKMPRAKKLADNSNDAAENSRAASENSTDSTEITGDKSTFVRGSGEAKEETARVLAMQKGGSESSSDSEWSNCADVEDCEFGDSDDEVCYFHFNQCPHLYLATSNSPSETKKCSDIRAILLPKKTAEK